MKKFTSFLFSMLIVFFFVSCTNSVDHEGEAKTPSGSKVQSGRDYQDVVDEFEDHGFTNIQLVALGDLITGWLHDDGEVKSVSVDGDEGYSADTWYPEDVEVVIVYHSWPINEEILSSQEESLSSENTSDNDTLSKSSSSVDIAELNSSRETMPSESDESVDVSSSSQSSEEVSSSTPESHYPEEDISSPVSEPSSEPSFEQSSKPAFEESSKASSEESVPNSVEIESSASSSEENVSSKEESVVPPPPIDENSSHSDTSESNETGSSTGGNSSDDPDVKYVVNVRTKVIHKPNCPSVDRMNESNKLYTNDDFESLLSRHYTPCNNCCPN